MAAFLDSKTASEVVRREWVVPVDDDDAPASVALSASGITVDASEFQGNTLILTLSAGTAAATGSIVATVTTDKSRTLIETLYIPIIESAAQIADTARSYIEFALRKIAGIGQSPSADELSDGLEQLNSLIAVWRAGGADIGAPFPITANSVIYCPDWAVDALRYNLRIKLSSLYGAQIDPMDMECARRGLQLIKHKNLPDERRVEFH